MTACPSPIILRRYTISYPPPPPINTLSYWRCSASEQKNQTICLILFNFYFMATVESELPPAPDPAPEKVETPVAVELEKPVDPPVSGDSKSIAVDEKTPVPEVMKKGSKNSLDRDVALAGVEKDKKLAFIKAWEESQKTKVENKAQKELSSIASWENTKKADVEAKLKQIEEQLEKKKADYAEKMKNKMALIHKQAEEKRAMVEATKGEEMLKAEELAAKYRAQGSVPKKLLGCLGG